MLSEYAQLNFPTGARAPQAWEFGGSGLSALFTTGAAGMVLDVLALLGVASRDLTSVAIIAFGSALVLSSNAVWYLSRLRQAAAPPEGQTVSGSVILANEMASGSSGVLSLAGLAAIILGVLAVAGLNPAADAGGASAARRSADHDRFDAERHRVRPDAAVRELLFAQECVAEPLAGGEAAEQEGAPWRAFSGVLGDRGAQGP